MPSCCRPASVAPSDIVSLLAAFKTNNMKGSIYMVFDYMDHDLTGLMERRNYKMDVSHVRPSSQLQHLH